MTPPNLSDASDQELVSLALEEREDAYRELVRRYQNRVYKLIYRMVRDRELAKDLTQDALVKAFSELASYRPEFKFSAWILKIANNLALDDFKRSRIESVPLEYAPFDSAPRKLSANPLALAERSDSTPRRARRRVRKRALELAIERLREDYRQCIILRDIEGRSYEDIAEILGLPVGTVGSHVHRARKELKAMLGPLRDSLQASEYCTPA